LIPSKKIISIIPARSGSSKVKNKNIRKLSGKPLIYYTIKASLNSKVSRTILSTDSPKIAKLAARFGAEVPFLRPKKYALKKSPSMAVILHCLDYLKKHEQYVPDYVVFLQPTSPFRTSGDIDNGINEILRRKTNSLIGLVEATQHPLWMFKKTRNNRLIAFQKNSNKPLRRQKLPKLYHINDALYISKRQYFDTASIHKPVIDLNDLTGLEMDPLNSLDINTNLDFEIAKKLHPLLKKHIN